MRRAWAALVVLAVLAASACGGDDGDTTELGALEPVVDIDPCALLTPEKAADLTGADAGDLAVDAEAAPETGLGSAIGCALRFDGGGGDEDVAGSGIAAALVLGETTEAPADALKTRLEELGADPDEALDVASLGDAAASFTTGEVVHVVYVVEVVVVSVEVHPVEAVDDAATDKVIGFAEETVEPVRDALAAKRGGDIQVGEIEGVWTGDWGTMVLQEVDGEVRGVYTHDDGAIVGTFEDGVMTGWWSEVPSREPPNDAGEVEFRFAKTEDGGISLDGRWRYGTEGEFSEDWDLALDEEEPPPELVARFDNDDEFVPHP